MGALQIVDVILPEEITQNIISVSEIKLSILRLINKQAEGGTFEIFASRVICRYPLYKELKNYSRKHKNRCIMLNEFLDGLYYQPPSVRTYIILNGEYETDLTHQEALCDKFPYKLGESAKAMKLGCSHRADGGGRRRCIIGIGDVKEIIMARHSSKQLRIRNKVLIDKLLYEYLISILKLERECDLPKLCERIINVHGCSLNNDVSNIEDIIPFLDKEIDHSNREIQENVLRIKERKQNFISDLKRYIK